MHDLEDTQHTVYIQPRQPQPSKSGSEQEADLTRIPLPQILDGIFLRGPGQAGYVFAEISDKI